MSTSVRDLEEEDVRDLVDSFAPFNLFSDSSRHWLSSAVTLRQPFDGYGQAKKVPRGRELSPSESEVESEGDKPEPHVRAGRSV